MSDALRQLQRQLTRAIALRLGWQVLAAIAAFAWGFLIVDRVFEPTAALRVVLYAIAAIPALGWLLAVAAPRLLRRIKPRDVLGIAAHHAPRDAALVSTALDLQRSTPAQSALVEATYEVANAAAQRLGTLRLVRSVASMPAVAFATVGLLGLLGLAAARPDLATVYAKRLTLDEAPWPRRVRLIAEGFRFDESAREWRRVAARGEAAELFVTASVEPGLAPPSTVWARGLGGPTTLSTLTRLATPADAEPTERQFRQRFASLDEDVTCVLRCGDARLRVRLVAAERPRLTDLRITASPPAYLRATEIAATPGTLDALPEGARVTLTASVDREIQSVAARRDASGPPLDVTIDSDRRQAEVDLGVLNATSQYVVTVTDTDGLISEPVVLDLECRNDAPPTASLALEGIGRAVTRDAILPLAIRVDDDHSVNEVAVEAASGERRVLIEASPPRDLPGAASAQIDLLSLRSADRDRSLAVEPGDRLLLTAVANDAYDLAPRDASRSAPIQLEVVSPTELQALLADAQRELRATLDTLRADAERLGYELDLQRRRLVEEDAPAEDRFARWAGERLLDARKTAQGVNGAADRAENLASQVENNRLDQPALAERLTLRVAAPLRSVLGGEFESVSRRLTALAAAPGNGAPAAIEVAQAAVDRIAETLAEAAASLETQDTYNEVVAMLRALVRDQRRVNERTTAASKASARRLLLD